MLVYPADHLPVNHVRLDTTTSADSSSRPLSKLGLQNNSVRRRFNGRNIRKRVTFKKDLVSIREIPPRESHSDSSDNDALTDSSSGEESDDSSSSESSDEDEGAGGGTMAEQISRLVLKHTRSKPARPIQEPRAIPPRPPRLRRPRLAPVHKKPDKVLQTKNQTRSSSGDSSNENTRARTLTALPAAGLGRLTQLRRPQSCAAEQREKTKPASVSSSIARSRSAKPTLTLTSRSTDGTTSMYSGLASAIDKMDNSNTNSGQERTKFYAWQVANGAPLVTTPGISPLYAEQVTVTKLKH